MPAKQANGTLHVGRKDAESVLGSTLQFPPFGATGRGRPPCKNCYRWMQIDHGAHRGLLERAWMLLQADRRKETDEMTVLDECAFELRFIPLREGTEAVAFPCDGKGRVALDSLSEKARAAYLFARAVVGCRYARPVVAATAD